MAFKPMLSGKFDLTRQRFPAIASPKIDGFRCLAMGGQAMSRSMKLIPNRSVQAFFTTHAEALEGLDGELVVGDPWAKDVFEQTSGPIRREDGTPNFTFWVFDRWDCQHGSFDAGYVARENSARRQVDRYKLPQVRMVPTETITDIDELDLYELEMLDLGYEGIMLRKPSGLYKQGRSSAIEGDLLKVKRNDDAEARIVGFEEEMKNNNEKQTNEIGRSKRSTHAENLVGKGTLGAFVVEGVNGTFKGVRFNIGTGFNASQRDAFWHDREAMLGKILTYKFFPIGCKDAPRHPVFQRFRPDFDVEI